MKKNIDFIGIGASRSGTSWIANVLRAHPEICMSEPKEIRYFNRHMIPAGKLKGRKNSNFDKDLIWYLRRFSHAREGDLCGEYSPIYLSDMEAPAAIKACFPEIKLIVCLRDPVEYAFSLYKLLKGNAVIENISFEEALKQDSVYIDTGRFSKHLERYLRFFDQQRILLLIFEELIADPHAGFHSIFEFLGVDPSVIADFSIFDKNPSAQRRSDRLHKLAFRLSQMLINLHLSSLLALLRDFGIHRLFQMINKAPASDESLNDSTRKYLADIFCDDIERLETMFDRDFKSWWNSCAA